MKMETWPGEHINTSCERAIKCATENNCVVTFDFNGVDMVATSKSQVSEMTAFFTSEMDRQREEYKASDAGKKQEADRLANITQQQAIIEDLMNNIDCLGEGLEFALDWLHDYTQAADWIGVDRHDDVVARKLRQEGYIANEGVGSDTETLKSNPEAIGRYLVGQALSCMDNGMPPHPMLTTWIERYRATLKMH